MDHGSWIRPRSPEVIAVTRGVRAVPAAETRGRKIATASALPGVPDAKFSAHVHALTASFSWMLPSTD
jgi:hypothetical protein